MKVWIDQDLCTGDAHCAECCPSVFGLGPDGLAYVHDGSTRLDAGPSGMLAVPDAALDDVLEAAEECPGECIFLEI